MQLKAETHFSITWYVLSFLSQFNLNQRHSAADLVSSEVSNHLPLRYLHTLSQSMYVFWMDADMYAITSNIYTSPRMK